MMLNLIAAMLLTQSDTVEPGMVQASTHEFTAASGATTANVLIKRLEGSAGAIGCSYTTVNGTAIAGTHYTAKSGTLSWAAGDFSDKTIAITVNNTTGSDLLFSVDLSLPTGGACLGVAPTSPLTNHVGRTIVPVAVGAPIDWATTGMDTVMDQMQLMPINSPWNERIDNTTDYPVHPNSGNIIGFMNLSSNLALNRDMNFVLVPGTQGATTFTLNDYPDESNLPPYPVPTNTPIEGWPVDDTRTLLTSQMAVESGDRHIMVLMPSSGKLYEFWQSRRLSSSATSAWEASNEATFNIRSNTLRDAGWTSGDAAGLPIMPAIPRYDECQRGLVAHAMRFTAHCRAGYVYPGNHSAAGKIGGVTVTNSNAPIMGQRFRLKAAVLAGPKFTAMGVHAKAIALGLNQYGMFMADNGGDWRLSAGSDPRMTSTTLAGLTALVPTDFEVIQTTGANGGPRAKSRSNVTLLAAGGGGGPDATPPTIAIQGPSGSATYAGSNASEDFSGIAADANLSSVTWTNSATGGSGSASGTGSWNATIAMASGSNTVTFTAHDVAGNTTDDVITVTYTPAAPGGGGGGGGGGSGGGGGGCGLLGVDVLVLWILRRACARK